MYGACISGYQDVLANRMERSMVNTWNLISEMPIAIAIAAGIWEV